MTLEQKRLARREFLTSVGNAVGSTAMLRTMVAMGIATASASCGSSSAAGGTSNPLPPPPPPPNAILSPRPGDWPDNVGIGKTVVILGGGIAGMTTAFEMTKLNYVCTILEALPAAGGRNRTIRAGDTATETDSLPQVCTFDFDPELYFNPGPSRISHHHEFLLGYCRQFGVSLEVFVNDNRAALIHSTSSFNGQPQIARRVIADLRGNISELLALAVNQNALDQELSAADKANILNMLSRYGDLNGSFDYVGTDRAGFPGQEDVGSRQRGSQVSSLDLQTLISESLWQSRSDFSQSLNQQATMLQPVGGMDKIARAFEAQVAADIVYEAVVTEIRKTANGTQVGYQDRNGAQSIETDYCICSIPATVLRSIPNDFSADHQNAITNFNYAAAGKIAFQSRRFWEQDHNIYGGISWTNQEITQIWYPSCAYGAINGIVVGAYMFGGAAGTNFANQTVQQRINSSISSGNNIHPEYANEVGRGISVAWPKVPYQLGAWGISNPGVLLTADENIFFAGEHLSILQGWQEGAILSAYNAIELVVQRDSL